MLIFIAVQSCLLVFEKSTVAFYAINYFILQRIHAKAIFSLESQSTDDREEQLSPEGNLCCSTGMVVHKFLRDTQKYQAQWHWSHLHVGLPGGTGITAEGNIQPKACHSWGEESSHCLDSCLEGEDISRKFSKLYLGRSVCVCVCVGALLSLCCVPCLQVFLDYHSPISTVLLKLILWLLLD